MVKVKPRTPRRMSGDTPRILDHFFRHQWARVISHLTRVMGAENLELIEDSVQEALMRAMQVWPYQGPPQNPEAWILTVARNNAYDVLRRRKVFQKRSWVDENHAFEPPQSVVLESELSDDLLKMIFACCHPGISQESQIILTLKILCGFGNSEIARALLKTEEAIAKAYTRAKKKLGETNPELKVPIGEDLNRRLQVVLKIIYLLYNEGYNSSKGESTINREFCFEAMRLTHVLAENEGCNLPELHALLALMYFHMSRFETRLGDNLEIKTLDKQNRAQWNREFIDTGLKHLEIANAGHDLSSYHLEAGIAACHCLAKDYASTDWNAILSLYDLLVQMEVNPIINLNRVVAYSKVHGPVSALQELAHLEGQKALNNYYLFYAIKGELLAEAGHPAQALELLYIALKLTVNKAERKHLKRKIDHLRQKLV